MLILLYVLDSSFLLDCDCFCYIVLYVILLFVIFIPLSGGETGYYDPCDVRRNFYRRFHGNQNSQESNEQKEKQTSVVHHGDVCGRRLRTGGRYRWGSPEEGPGRGGHGGTRGCRCEDWMGWWVQRWGCGSEFFKTRSHQSHSTAPDRAASPLQHPGVRGLLYAALPGASENASAAGGSAAAEGCSCSSQGLLFLPWEGISSGYRGPPVLSEDGGRSHLHAAG